MNAGEPVKIALSSRAELSGDWQKIGRQFAEGVLVALGKWLAISLVVLLVAAALSDAAGYRHRDATDSPTTRSGLKLRTDFGTACQYLESVDGFLTPRLRADGRPMCGSR